MNRMNGMKYSSMAAGQTGFTLIEVLMSLTVMVLILSVSYTALGPAGEGFLQLQEGRDSLESSSWAGRQLRMDIGMATAGSMVEIIPVSIQRDGRGDRYFDQLTLLVREAGKPGLTLVHYLLDEDRQMLVRESRLAWARQTTESVTMDITEAESFQVELMNAQGMWVNRWDNANAAFIWPRAARIHLISHGRERQWVASFPLGLNTP